MRVALEWLSTRKSTTEGKYLESMDTDTNANTNSDMDMAIVKN